MRPRLNAFYSTFGNAAFVLGSILCIYSCAMTSP